MSGCHLLIIAVPLILSELLFCNSICRWIQDFQTGRPQTVRVGTTYSASIVLNTEAPQGCCLSPLLYSLYTYDCIAKHPTNSIVKFADDTTVIGLIDGNNKTAYRDEVRNLIMWCRRNNLSLNVGQSKELIIDFKKNKPTHTPVYINNSPVEIVNTFKFLGIHISDSLSWSFHISCAIKKAHQRLYFLRCLKKYGMSLYMLQNLYRCTAESILTGNIVVWLSGLLHMTLIY